MSNLKDKLILNRLGRVYCRLAPSKIHGIGIFAIRDIPIGTNPFKDSYMAQDSVLIDKKKVPDELKTMLEDYHPSDKNSSKCVVSSYPNQPIWSNYLNYSDEPNIELMLNGEWKTLRPIKEGEELVEDPSRLFNEDGTQKIFRLHEHQYPSMQP